MKEKSDSTILFLGKQDDSHCSRALEFCKRQTPHLSVHLGKWGDPLPKELETWNGDIIISYLSRWIIPDSLLRKARLAAINFHPASPDYPGFGCINFALYENAKEYGVTCHHMKAKVDTGNIIAVKRFPIFPTDDVKSLLLRTYDYQIILFYEILEKIFRNLEIPESKEQWTRKPFTKNDFEELNKIKIEMTPDEIARRVKATSYEAWHPTLELAGFNFELKAMK